jgi:hypothetical protein
VATSSATHSSASPCVALVDRRARVIGQVPLDRLADQIRTGPAGGCGARIQAGDQVVAELNERRCPGHADTVAYLPDFGQYRAYWTPMAKVMVSL